MYSSKVHLLLVFRVSVSGTRGVIEVNAGDEGIFVASDSCKTPLVLDWLTEEEPIRYFVDCIRRDVEPVPGSLDGLEVTRVNDRVMQLGGAPV